MLRHIHTHSCTTLIVGKVVEHAEADVARVSAPNRRATDSDRPDLSQLNAFARQRLVEARPQVSSIDARSNSSFVTVEPTNLPSAVMPSGIDSGTSPAKKQPRSRKDPVQSEDVDLSFTTEK
jgi:hypothetical protein